MQSLKSVLPSSIAVYKCDMICTDVDGVNSTADKYSTVIVPNPNVLDNINKEYKPKNFAQTKSSSC